MFQYPGEYTDDQYTALVQWYKDNTVLSEDDIWLILPLVELSTYKDTLLTNIPQWAAAGCPGSTLRALIVRGYTLEASPWQLKVAWAACWNVRSVCVILGEPRKG